MDEKDLQLLLDKQACAELACRYSRGLDRLDAELLLSVFWEDAWCEYGVYDGDAAGFVSFAMGALESHAANHHMVGNTLVEVEGNEAFGEVYFNAYHKVPVESGFDDLLIAGRYLDRYEKRDGQWKIAYRSEHNDWSHTRPCNDPYFDRAPQGLRGSRRDDPVYDRARRYRPE